MLLAEKVVLITGSATGVGRAIARRSVAEGARVLIHGLPGTPTDALMAELGPERAALHLQDLTEEGCAARLVERTLGAFGRLDAVVNNAALIKAGNLHDTTASSFARMLAINTIAPFLLIQAALPALRETSGSVLNIGSVNAWCGEPNLLPYAVSKGALMTMTRNLGDVLLREDGVRVNQLNLGWVHTEAESRRKQQEGLPENWTSQLPATMAPTGRILRPEEIAAAAVFWLSGQAGPISGQVFDLEQYPFIGRNPPKDPGIVK